MVTQDEKYQESHAPNGQNCCESANSYGLVCTLTMARTSYDGEGTKGPKTENRREDHACMREQVLLCVGAACPGRKHAFGEEKKNYLKTFNSVRW